MLRSQNFGVVSVESSLYQWSQESKGHTPKEAQWDLGLEVSQERGFLVRLPQTAKV